MILTLVPIIANLIFKYLGQNQANTATLSQIQGDVEKALIAAESDIAKASAQVVIAEAQSESWMARNWRPISALCFVAIILWYGWMQPALYAWADVAPLKIGDPLLMEIIGLVKLCLGGYIGGRSLEKIASSFIKK